MMEYVKRDPNTDEIIGIAENAPAEIVQMYCAYMAETERREPVER